MSHHRGGQWVGQSHQRVLAGGEKADRAKEWDEEARALKRERKQREREGTQDEDLRPATKRTPELSQHQTDIRLRAIAAGVDEPNSDDAVRAKARMASAGFNTEKVRVKQSLVRREFQGRKLRRREDSAVAHLAKRTLDNRQWSEATTVDAWFSDLFRALNHPETRMLTYNHPDGVTVASVIETAKVVPTERLGPEAQDLLCVIYSADRGKIVSGFQTSSIDKLPHKGLYRWLP